MNHLPHLTAALALATLVPAQLQAQTKLPCLTEREVAQMAIYAVPAMVDGVRGKCRTRLSSSGYLATKGNAFAARYAALQNETWPIAKAGILKFIGGTANAKGAEPLAMMAALPDESVRPLVDAMIAQKIGHSIKPETCTSVERGMQLVSTLTPRDSRAMIAFVMAMTKPKTPSICPAQP